MPADTFLDSNVIIYAVGDDEARREIAATLIARQPAVSSQVLAEVAAVLRRKLQMPRPAVEALLQTVLAHVRCDPVGADTVLAALRIGERYGYGHYDSQIIAAALAAGCELLYSEDLHDGQLIDGTLTIVNPFLRTA